MREGDTNNYIARKRTQILASKTKIVNCRIRSESKDINSANFGTIKWTFNNLRINRIIIHQAQTGKSMADREKIKIKNRCELGFGGSDTVQ